MPGSDSKINYYLRPQKSIERKMMCELFHRISLFSDPSKCRYIGMGAKYFTDFLLFHKECGFNKMISIEGDPNVITNPDLKQKYEFNKPLNCIEMNFNFSSEAILGIDWDEYPNNIIWLDYDQTLCNFMLEDIKVLLTKLKKNNLFFISINASSSKFNDASKIYSSLKDELGDSFPSTLSKSSFNKTNKYNSLKMIFDKTINDTLNRRYNGITNEDELLEYHQLVFFKYKDGAEMLTLGGILTTPKFWRELTEKNFFNNLPFLVTDPSDSAFSLELPLLTYKEASYLLKSLPCEDLSSLNLPWFNMKELEQLSNLYRYIPIYLESSNFA